MSMTFDLFQEQFAAKMIADWGALTAFGNRLEHPGPPKAAADSFCQSLKGLRLRSLGEDWIDFEWLPRHSRFRWIAPATQLATRLERTLAHHYPLFRPADAIQLAHDFYALFQAGKLSRLTTGLGPHPLSGGAVAWSGNPITDYATDHAYVAMDDAHIGLILLFDED